MVLTTRDKLGSFTAEAFANQVRHLDEEGAAVAAEARLELSRERTEAVARQVVVVSSIKRSAGIRCVAKEELRAGAGGQCVIVDARGHKREAVELVRRAKQIEVVLI